MDLRVFTLSDSEDDINPIINLSNTFVYPFARRGSIGSSRSSPLHHVKQSPSLFIGCPSAIPSPWKLHSIVDLLEEAALKKSRRLDIFNTLLRVEVKHLPPSYDRDGVFKLPLRPEGCAQSYGGNMDGMGKEYNSHTWCKSMTSKQVMISIHPFKSLLVLAIHSVQMTIAILVEGTFLRLTLHSG